MVTPTNGYENLYCVLLSLHLYAENMGKTVDVTQVRDSISKEREPQLAHEEHGRERCSRQKEPHLQKLSSIT